MSGRLALCCAPQFLIALDFSVMTVAIAPLARDLGLAGERTALVLAAYSLPFGSLLVGSGLLVDRAGPRRCLTAGFALFACGGLGAVAAQTGPVLLACRALQGAGAAVIVPAGLAVTTWSHRAAPARRRALAWYAASISIGFVTGALASGAVSELWGWRAAVGVPVLVALLALAGCRLAGIGAAAPPAATARIATAPAVLATAAALAGSCAVCLAGGGYGGVPALAGAVAAAVALGAAAHRRRGALVPLGLARDRGFRLVVAGAAIVTASGVSGSLLLSLHLQATLGYSPLQTAVVFVGFGLVALAGRRCATALGRRGGDVLGRGLALQGIGLAALAATLAVLPVPLALVLVTSLFGLGHVVANAGVALGTAATPAGSHGLAAALVASAQYVSGALGSLAVVSGDSGVARLAVVGTVALLGGLALERRMWVRKRESGS